MSPLEFPRNFWYPILESRKIKTGSKPIGIQRLSESLVLWRDSDGKVHCLLDRCPHRGAKLSLGKVLNDRIQCGYHGFEFNKQGECASIPAYGKLKSPQSC